MFNIYKDNKLIATTEKPLYVKKHPENGCYIPAKKNDATGISVQSLQQVFALAGKELDGLDQVAVVEVDGGGILTELIQKEMQARADVDYIAIMTGVDLDV